VDLGRRILDRLVEELGETIVVEMMPKQEGRNMIMVIAPNKRYAEQQAKLAKNEEDNELAEPLPEAGVAAEVAVEVPADEA
jgi:translation initiation factor IF-3